MSAKKILLLGVGNILYKDEGLGVYAVQHLEANYSFPDHVTVMDGGVMGKMLMNVLIDHDFVIVADAVLGGGAPGSVYRLLGEGLRKSLGFRDSQHDVDLVDTLISCELIGKRPDVVVIGMEPGGYLTLGTEMTEACAAAFPKFLGHILEELEAAGVKAAPKNA
ncbi:HyaD/HybD family hydrogenase maturation endopeptidase [Desulfovibrio sp. OttesenSCG-928-G11]|nr:HyaD/HybD family hydrogenase maturation endopeptidase [Desulfovibrio sp. OttesenSCG-928-G11]